LFKPSLLIQRFLYTLFALCIIATVALWWSGYPQQFDLLQSWLIAITLITFFVYGYDKIISRFNIVRVPEQVLVILTFAGGTVGALVGMWLFRHKTRKMSFHLKLMLVMALQLFLVVAYYKWVKPLF